MNKLTILTGIAFASVLVFTSCNKDNNDCKVCRYTEVSGNTVSMGELCGDEYKTVETSGFLTSEGIRPVSCE